LDFAVDTIVITMENYGEKWAESKTFLSFLLGYEGLLIHFCTLFDRIVAANYMGNFGLDFDDALALQAMNENGTENIMSYDKHFDRVPDMKRIIPESLVPQRLTQNLIVR